MHVVDKKISIEELSKMSEKMFGNLVKAVVDVEQGIMVVDAEFHADQEYLLLEQGSRQENLWGFNLYPAKMGSAGWIEFDSMVNLRPSQNNRSRGVDDQKTQIVIRAIVDRLVTS